MTPTPIDRRHRYGIMLDTETANTHCDGDTLDMSDVLFYDLGFAVIDSHGRVYETYSFVNSDIFIHEPELMESAYYAHKIPFYEADLQEGRSKLANTYQIRKFLSDKIKEYNCQFIVAHNCGFDLRACNNTQRWTTKSQYRYFFPFGIEIYDTLKMAKDVICTMPTYIRFCEENEYLTSKGAPRATAETLYRFITGNNDFIESHTGLEDVLIEVKIFEYCVRKHKKMRKNLFKNP